MDMPPALDNALLLRQPILDAKQEPAGYALHFVGAGAPGVGAAFSELGLGAALANRPVLLRADARLIMDEIVARLPAGVILELDLAEAPDAALLDRCRALRAGGRALALPAGADDAGRAALLPLADVVGVDARADDADLAARVADLAGAADGRRPRILADGVDTRERMARCRELGCDLFRGFHFARPRPVEGRGMNASQLGIIRLLNQVAREADAHDLEEGFKREPGLTVNLLRLVNSVGVGAAQKVDSLRHAIAILGRKQLLRWLQLLLMASPSGGAPERDPLLQLAAQRGGLMERLAALRAPADRALAEEAFLVGVMSLMPAALGQPIEDILAQIPVAEPVHRALAAREGELGLLLALVEALDDGDAARCDALLAELPPLARGTVTASLCAVLVWLHGDRENA